jgi:hypothetical protein
MTIAAVVPIVSGTLAHAIAMAYAVCDDECL